MAEQYRTLNIEIVDCEAAIETWTTTLERAHSWGTPQRVTIGSRAASSTNIKHDMIKTGDLRLQTSIRSDNANFNAQGLIDFLRKLRSLSDLEWQSSTPLVSSLIQFLREELPSCNLHLKPFCMPYDAEPSYIRSVLCLPNLQTLWLERKQDGAMQDLVQHTLLAPNGNLREVRILWSYTGASPYGGGEDPIVWDPELNAHDGQRLGQLQYLQLTGIQGAEATSLQTWARHTDFSQLRELSLEMPLTQAALETLINLPLQSLHSLGLVLDPRDTSDNYSTTLQTFICNLPSLSHLRLTGALPSSTLKTILNHLEPTLQTLYLIPGGKDPNRFSFDSSTIALVTDTCNHVQDLGISIRRFWNKPGQDIAVLKAIGRMPHLSNLDLTFDASDYTVLFQPNNANNIAPSDPSFTAFDEESFPTDFFNGPSLRKGHIRDALINSAINADLAKAVFNTIVSAQTTPDSETPSFLKRLSLKATGGGNFGTGSSNGTISQIVEEVGKEWIVERSGSRDGYRGDDDGDGDGIEVRRKETDNDEWIEPSDSLGWDVEPIFRRVWDYDDEVEDWFDAWKAFLLV